ncbi:MAG: MBL fold metallo-hydrolase [Longimicrobiales bacterium]|nr:MBL fold metallo-hydrolase [Longimicrobiales bacterium]
MRFTILGSGSRGNATLIEVANTRVLVDAGFSARELARRLAAIGVSPDGVDGIVVTHDHGDHTRGIGVFARRHSTPIWITDGTREACARLFRGTETLHAYRPGHPFAIGGLRIEPFLTVHDAVDPVGVSVIDPASALRLGIATDLGRPTAGIRLALSRCHALILEANHDEALLQDAPYPWSVKARIRSSHGHLSNHAAAQFACELLHSSLETVVLAHLSAESNRPALAHGVVAAALRGAGFEGRVDVATQDDPTPWFTLGCAAPAPPS